VARFAIYYQDITGGLVLVCLGRSSFEAKSVYDELLPEINLKEVQHFIMKVFIEQHKLAGYWRVVSTWKV
jgi:hypothetical protein